MSRFRVAAFCITVATALVAVPPVAQADSIDTGPVPLHLLQGINSFAEIDFGTFGGGILHVELKGGHPPLIPGTNADTIVDRLDSLGPGETGEIPIELVALNLQSVAPIEVTTGSFFDVFVSLDPGQQSFGTIDVTDHNDPDGGFFNIAINPFIRIILQEQGGPGFEIQDIQFFIAALRIAFFHGETLNINPIILDDFQSGDLRLEYGPAEVLGPGIPEPASLTLLMTGGIGLLLYRRRKRKMPW